MLSTESSLLKRLINILFLGIGVATAAVYTFRAELSDTLTDALQARDGAVKRVWSPETPGSMALRPERNDDRLLKVGALHAGTPSSIGIPVSFELTNLGDANDFPNVAVVMIGAAGRETREVVFTPADYTHSSKFETQSIELLLHPRGEERSFTVRVFYGDRT